LYMRHTTAASISTLSLHDALPISHVRKQVQRKHTSRKRFIGLGVQRKRDIQHGKRFRTSGNTDNLEDNPVCLFGNLHAGFSGPRSVEHTSELQSRENLVCRLLLEK